MKIVNKPIKVMAIFFTDGKIEPVKFRLDDKCICQPKIRSKDHSILGHFLVNKCASENCTKAQTF